MTLLDRINYREWRPVARPELLAAIPRARKFVFDGDASTMAGNVMRSCDDLILRHREFALPPYPVSYIEFRMDLYLSGSHVIPTEFPDIADTCVGYLYDNGKIYTIVDDPDRNRVSVSPFVYTLGAYQKSLDFLDYDRIMADIDPKAALLLGTSAEKLTESERQTISNMISVDLMYGSKGDAAKMLQGSMGDIRNVWTLFMLLNAPSKMTTLNLVPPHRKIVKGKLKAYSAYHRVSLHLLPEPTVRKILAPSDRSSPRRHEVKAHFAHYHKVRGCEHNFVKISGDRPRWRCSHCGTLRIRREPYLRGDASRGFVRKEYAVTP